MLGVYILTPGYVVNYSSNPNFYQNAFSGAVFDVGVPFHGAADAISALHFRYDQVRGFYTAFDQHFVHNQDYAVFSVDPLTQNQRQFNAILYKRLSPDVEARLFYQLSSLSQGLNEPSQSSTYGNFAVNSKIGRYAVGLNADQFNDDLLADAPPPDQFTPWGLRGDGHPFDMELSVLSFENEWRLFRYIGVPLKFQYRAGYGYNYDSYGLPTITGVGADGLYQFGGVHYPIIFNKYVALTAYTNSMRIAKQLTISAKGDIFDTWYSLPHQVDTSDFSVTLARTPLSVKQPAYLLSYDVANIGDNYYSAQANRVSGVHRHRHQSIRHVQRSRRVRRARNHAHAVGIDRLHADAVLRAQPHHAKLQFISARHSGRQRRAPPISSSPTCAFASAARFWSTFRGCTISTGAAINGRPSTRCSFHHDQTARRTAPHPRARKLDRLRADDRAGARTHRHARTEPIGSAYGLRYADARSVRHGYGVCNRGRDCNQLRPLRVPRQPHRRRSSPTRAVARLSQQLRLLYDGRRVSGDRGAADPRRADGDTDVGYAESEDVRESDLRPVTKKIVELDITNKRLQTSRSLEPVKGFVVVKSSPAPAPEIAGQNLTGKQVAVVFEITVPPTTAFTDQIYIATDTSDWNPTAIKLDRVDSYKYRALRYFASGTKFAYRVTRGTWNSVERGEDNLDAPPHQFFVREVDALAARVTVYHWSDERGSSLGAGPNSIPTPYNPSPFVNHKQQRASALSRRKTGGHAPARPLLNARAGARCRHRARIALAGCRRREAHRADRRRKRALL